MFQYVSKIYLISKNKRFNSLKNIVWSYINNYNLMSPLHDPAEVTVMSAAEQFGNSAHSVYQLVVGTH